MQHLNLYSQLDRAVEPSFSARLQVQLLAVLVLLLLLIYLVLVWSSSSLRAESGSLQQQESELAASLKTLQARKVKLERESTLDVELDRLAADITFRRQLMASIDPNSAVMESGFATHLQGLGRQHIEGMWFTQIQLQLGGQQLALKGQTRVPEAVPQYLQKLSKEPVFSGHQFRVFKLNVPEDKTGVLEFELRAFESESGNNRGERN
ncbi:MAG: cell division protein FtsB [Oceanicoccus sp.]